MNRLRLPTIALMLLALAGCGSSSSSSSASSTSAPAASGASGAIQVTIKNLAFSPAVIHAKVGQSVEWTNDDQPSHNVTYTSGPKFTSSPTMPTGATFQLKLTQAGTIQYFCSIHPFMKASIVVS